MIEKTKELQTENSSFPKWSNRHKIDNKMFFKTVGFISKTPYLNIYPMGGTVITMTTFSIITLSITTFCIMTVSIMTFRLAINKNDIQHNETQHATEHYYALCHLW